MIYCYHHNDLDGITAGAVVRLRFPTEDIEFESISYPVDKERILTSISNRDGIITLYFVDISFTENDKDFLVDLSKLCDEKNIMLVWIDHHTASANLVKNWKDIPPFFKYVDEHGCGAVLAYEYFHKDDNSKIPMFLLLVDAWDRHLVSSNLWQSAIYFNYAMMAEEELTPNSKVYNELLSSKVYVATMVDTGKIIYNYVKKTSINTLASDAFVFNFKGFKCLGLNYHGSSMVFDSVRSRYPLCMQWHYDGHLYHYSIYTDDKSIDCSGIANMYGGGGHRGAAGFSSNTLLPEIGSAIIQRLHDGICDLYERRK